MMNKSKKESSLTGLEIAVIGMFDRFPGARNIDKFWNNQSNGRHNHVVAYLSMIVY